MSTTAGAPSSPSEVVRIDPADWLLTKAERANPRTVLDDPHPDEAAWSVGNLARPLIHGTSYFAELAERIAATQRGDFIYFTDWRGDADERLTADPHSTVFELLSAADERGVDVRGLIWRSHWDKLSLSARENRRLGEELQHTGAEALLDMRVRSLGSHHQKLVIIRHRDHPERDVAYIGGIDMCHSRHDDAQHGGDPQALDLAPEYGPTPPWHDAQVALSGPVVYDVETVFRERWLDPTPLSQNPIFWLHDKLTRTDLHPSPLPPQAPPPDPVPGGTHVVQLLRTYPNLRHGRDYVFARGGERSVARGYSKALARANHLVYVEDQYLWSLEVAHAFVTALQRSPELRVLVVLPRLSEQPGLVSRTSQNFGRWETLSALRAAGGDRVATYSVENHAGVPVYVHAKVCIMDDIWATIGSDNFNRRSWTHDSELSAVVLDLADGDGLSYATRLRLALAAEHLDRGVESGDVSCRSDTELTAAVGDCVDGSQMFAAFAESAARLDAWYEAGQQGPRPPGRLRRYDPPKVSRVNRLWARPVYQRMLDPDGRPAAMRRRHEF